MEDIGLYIFRICCCALIVGALQAVSGTGTNGSIKKLIGGLFMAFVVISPLRQIELGELWRIPEDHYRQGQAISEQAQSDTVDAISDIIIQRTQAYILDEAKSLDAMIEVTAIALDPETLEPLHVELTGKISPHDRAVLSESIESNLGIAKEEQVWNS